MPQMLSLFPMIYGITRILEIMNESGFRICPHVKLRSRTVVVGNSRWEQGDASLGPVFPADERLLENMGESPFDLIVCSAMIEHLHTPEEFLEGCLKALNPGGRFVCCTPYHGFLRGFALSLANKRLVRRDPKDRTQWTSERNLTHLLKEVGFTKIQTVEVTRFPLMPLATVLAADKPGPPLPYGFMDFQHTFGYAHPDAPEGAEEALRRHQAGVQEARC